MDGWREELEITVIICAGRNRGIGGRPAPATWASSIGRRAPVTATDDGANHFAAGDQLFRPPEGVSL
jgi:predicted NAD/FAD-dependent oxidoreductase